MSLTGFLTLPTLIGGSLALFYLIPKFFSFGVQDHWLLQELDRGEFTFSGWYPKPVRKLAKDVTVTPHWTANLTEFVEIAFGKKDLKKDEVRKILQGT